jgi:mono/diheme cytochrome c family protein
VSALRITIVLLLTCVTQTLVTAKDTTAITLEAARELGRANSRLLKETANVGNGTAAVPAANVSHFHQVIAPTLNKTCLNCHGPERTEGRLRVDQLDPDLLNGGDTERWREIYNAVSNAAMPPVDEPDYALADEDRERMVDWLGEEMNKASVVRRKAAEHSSFRRLTKYEYNYALQDLLGLPYELANRLPPEAESTDGFKNSSELLQMSAMQFQTYREIGLAALRRATVGSERPQTVTYVISMQDEFDRAVSATKTKAFDSSDDNFHKKRLGQILFNRESGDGVPFKEGVAAPKPSSVFGLTLEISPVVLVLPGSKEVKWNLDRFLPDEGVMRVRIRAGRSTMNPVQYASLRLIFSAHTSNNANFEQVISQRDIPVTASVDVPQYITFDIPLQDIQRNPFRKLETTFPRRDEFLSIRNVSNANGRNEPLLVFIDQLEITAPFYEQWPPKTHTDIFFASDNSGDESVYGREVLSKFLRRVWRRPVTAHEVDPFMALFTEYRPEFSSLEEAMIEVMATALASPEFLYITHRISTDQADIITDRRSIRPQSVDQPDRRLAISDVELASRLSFFLWASIPDETLLELAEQGRLTDPEVLRIQVDRMLADPRSRRFGENFVEQWLGLDRLESVTHVTDTSLKKAMREEPIAFFEQLLNDNGSVLDFVHSNYVIVNEILAKHYGISEVYGPHFRRVVVESQVNRGGILTAAGILAMNSDGKDSHPLKRGVWMLERILQDPPPPPPPNVPEVDLTDPEILKMTLKERIADHRNKAACLSCHSKIDPWGIAFENFDALGAYRSEINNKPVDATAQLFNQQELAGIAGLKRYLFTSRQDQFARALVDKMTAYALGRPLSFADRADIDNMTRQFRRQDDRLRDLIHLIVGSSIFGSQ